MASILFFPLCGDFRQVQQHSQVSRLEVTHWLSDFSPVTFDSELLQSFVERNYWSFTSSKVVFRPSCSQISRAVAESSCSVEYR